MCLSYYLYKQSIHTYFPFIRSNHIIIFSTTWSIYTHTQKPEAFCDLFIYIIFLQNQLEKSTNECISDTQLQSFLWKRYSCFITTRKLYIYIYINITFLDTQGYFFYNISLAVSLNMHTNNIVFISIMLHFKCIDYFIGKLKDVGTFLTSVASVNDVN